jgi:hypothetical protein
MAPSQSARASRTTMRQRVTTHRLASDQPLPFPFWNMAYIYVGGRSTTRFSTYVHSPSIRCQMHKLTPIQKGCSPRVS